MREETVTKFKEFDFSKDIRWQEYLTAIYPVPPLDKLNKMRKKWYKNNVDQEFDPEVDLDAPAPQPQASQGQENTGGHSQANYGQSEVAMRPFASNKLYHVEGLMKVVFIVGSFVVQFLPFLHLYLMLACSITCVLGLYRQHGKPRFNQEYLAEFMGNEFGMALFYLLSVCSMPSRGPFIYLPLMMHFVLGVAEFAVRTSYPFLTISKVSGFLQAVQQMKHEVRVGKAYAEFFNLFYFIVLVLLGKMSILFVIIYLQFVKFKFKMNQTSHLAVTNAKNWLREKAGRLPAVGPVLCKAVDGVFWIVSY